MKIKKLQRHIDSYLTQAHAYIAFCHMQKFSFPLRLSSTNIEIYELLKIYVLLAEQR